MCSHKQKKHAAAYGTRSWATHRGTPEIGARMSESSDAVTETRTYPVRPPSSYRVWLSGNIDANVPVTHKLASAVHWLMRYDTQTWMCKNIVSLPNSRDKKAWLTEDGRPGGTLRTFFVWTSEKIRRFIYLFISPPCDDVSNTFQLRALHFNHETGDMTSQLPSYTWDTKSKQIPKPA